MGIIGRLIKLIVSGSKNKQKSKFSIEKRKGSSRADEDDDDDEAVQMMTRFGMANLKPIFTIAGAGELLAAIVFFCEQFSRYQLNFFA